MSISAISVLSVDTTLSYQVLLSRVLFAAHQSWSTLPIARLVFHSYMYTR